MKARDQSYSHWWRDLSQRDQAIVVAREKGATYDELGRRFDVSNERARQIYVREKRRESEMTDVSRHPMENDWCHLCGSRLYPTADIWYPANPERKGRNSEYIRICSNCAGRVTQVTNPDHRPEIAQTTFDQRLAEAGKLLESAVDDFKRNLHAKYADKLIRAIDAIRQVRQRYQ